ncbi:MAG TPA: type II secretion system protein [Candidatus Saccharimonadales bacterium]
MRKSISGFTIVELIVAITVIGILAAIVIVAYNGFQTRTKAGVIEVGLKDIEKSLRVYGADQKWSSWPLDTAIDPSVPGGTPTIQQLITDLPNYAQYLKTAPSTSDFPTSAWTYDYDGDVKSSCGTLASGTNIMITGVPSNVASSVDSAMDDGNTNCGRIRYDSTTSRLYYSLSYTNDLNL